MKQNHLIVIGVLGIALLYMGGYLFSIFPITRNAYVGIPFQVQFYSGRTEITTNNNCQIGEAQASLLQEVYVVDEALQTQTKITTKFGYPSCADSTYGWPITTWTPSKTGAFVIKSVITDTFTSGVENVDEWPIIVQTATSPVCTSGQLKCDASNTDRLIECGSEGQWTIWGDTCPAGCVDPGNGMAYCAQLCTPGSYQCVSGTTVWYQMCAADGHNWETTELRCLDTEKCVAGQTSPCHTTCGDGTCGYFETHTTCPGDCPLPAVCGDGFCNGGETHANCPSDCGTTICGDNKCEGGETATSCAADCGDVPSPIPSIILVILAVGVGLGLIMLITRRK